MYAPHPHRLRSLLLALCYLAGGLLVGAVAGYQAGRLSHQNLNALLSVDFRLYDPDGYRVERFDDGLISLVHDYWTTVDKPPSNHDNPFENQP